MLNILVQFKKRQLSFATGLLDCLPQTQTSSGGEDEGSWSSWDDPLPSRFVDENMCGIPDIEQRTLHENPEMICPGDTEEVLLLFHLPSQTDYKTSLIRQLGQVTTTSVLTGKNWNLAGDVTVSMTVLEEKTKSTAKRLT